MPTQFLAGLERFRREHFPRFRERYERLVAEGQRPSTLFIGCSDSRILPDVLTGTGPGELFIVRNMGAFVPSFDPESGFHGTAASIEFAVVHLRVTDIVVCGHTHCGAVRALYEPPEPRTPHIAGWLGLAADARLEGPVDAALLRRSEQRAVALQLRRLLAYPMVAERVGEGTLSLHGWHYVIEEGRVDVLDIERGRFVSAQAS